MIYPYPVKYNGELYLPGANVPDETKKDVKKAKSEPVEKTGSENEPKTTKRRKQV